MTLQPQTFTEQYLHDLMPSEKDYLSEIAQEALSIMQSDRTPAQDDRLHAITRILQPVLEAMARDGYDAPQQVAPAMVNGRYNIVR